MARDSSQASCIWGLGFDSRLGTNRVQVIPIAAKRWRTVANEGIAYNSDLRFISEIFENQKI